MNTRTPEQVTEPGVWHFTFTTDGKNIIGGIPHTTNPDGTKTIGVHIHPDNGTTLASAPRIAKVAGYRNVNPISAYNPTTGETIHW